jgi:hypothetical protein
MGLGVTMQYEEKHLWSPLETTSATGHLKTLVNILLETKIFVWLQDFQKEFMIPGINCTFLKLISKTKKEELVSDHTLARTYVGPGPQYR